MSHDDHSFCAINLGSVESFLVHTYGFVQHHMCYWKNSFPIWLYCNTVIHSVHRELHYKNCLCTSNL